MNAMVDNDAWTDAECWAHNFTLAELERGAAGSHRGLDDEDYLLLVQVCTEAAAIKRAMM